jgi:hypothetical protein
MRPYADDWRRINPDTEYSPSQQLWYHNNRTYDRRSAEHNGIIGLGAELKRLLGETREDK